MLDEASQVIAYSHELKSKSRELLAATAELRAANERLQELDRLKDDFISTVTHELRTPLTSIRAFSEILHDNPDLDSAEREKFLNIIIQESERLTRLINQVLDLAKLESGRAEWQVQEIDLKAVIEDSINATGQLFHARNVGLETRLPDSVPPIHADRDRLVQVLINLLSNAAKFVPARRRPRRRRPVAGPRYAARRGDRQRPRHSPRGSEDHLRKVPPGRRHDDGEAAGHRASGLPISRQIIEHFGGRLWVESVPGAGATFVFELPQATPAGPRAAAASPAARGA